MNKFFKIFTLLLTVILLVTLCGCSKYDSKANIYFELNELPKTLDAQTAESVSELIAVRNIYEGLTRKNEAGDIVLGVAESYEYKNLPKQWLLQFRYGYRKTLGSCYRTP